MQISSVENIIKKKNMINLNTPDESNNLNGPLNIKQLSNILKNMKNNKTQGLNGFLAEFYKMFWRELQFFSPLRALNESLEK